MSWSADWSHRVRWAECDLHGHVNHTAYLVMFEDMRVAHWESLGQSFKPNSVGPVVAQLTIRYLAPLAFGDEVSLSLRVLLPPCCISPGTTQDINYILDSFITLISRAKVPSTCKIVTLGK